MKQIPKIWKIGLATTLAAAFLCLGCFGVAAKEEDDGGAIETDAESLASPASDDAGESIADAADAGGSDDAALAGDRESGTGGTVESKSDLGAGEGGENGGAVAAGETFGETLGETLGETFGETAGETLGETAGEAGGGILDEESASGEPLYDWLTPQTARQIRDLLLQGVESAQQQENGDAVYAILSWIKENISAISLALYGILLIVAAVMNAGSKKSFLRGAATLNNNAVQAFDKNEQTMKQTTDIVTALSGDVTAALKRTEREWEKFDATLQDNSRAAALTADIVNELLQLSNIPEAKKDAIFKKYTEARGLLERESASRNSDTAQTSDAAPKVD